MINLINAIHTVNHQIIYYVANCIFLQVHKSGLSFMKFEDFKSSIVESTNSR